MTTDADRIYQSRRADLSSDFSRTVRDVLGDVGRSSAPMALAPADVQSARSSSGLDAIPSAAGQRALGSGAATFAGREDEIRDLLPEPARGKYQKLVDDKDAANAVLRPVQDKLNERRSEQERIENRKRQLTHGARAPNNRVVEVTNQIIIDLDKELDAVNREIERLSGELERRSVRWRGLASLVHKLTLHIAKLPDDLEIAVAKPIENTAGPSSFEMIEAARDTVATLKADIHETMSQTITRAQAKLQMRKQLRDVAENGRPDLDLLIANGGQIAWPRTRTSTFRGVDVVALDDAVALLVWANESAIVKALDKEIDSLLAEDSGLSDADRAARLTTLYADLLKNERMEESLIEAAELLGMDVMRRPDADPRAVLGLADDVSPRGL